MKYYLVTYDINEGNPRDLEQHLQEQVDEKLGCRPLKNIWIVKSSETREKLFKYYYKKITYDDRLLIIEFDYFFIANMMKDANIFMNNERLLK